VELSGGRYEVAAMQGEARDGRALAREAYFLEFARQIQTVAKMPVMSGKSANYLFRNST
jgi:hypothetical protein